MALSDYTVVMAIISEKVVTFNLNGDCPDLWRWPLGEAAEKVLQRDVAF